MNFETMKERSANALKSLLTKGDVALYDIDLILSDLDDLIDDIELSGADKDLLNNACYYERNSDFRLTDSSENQLFRNKAFSCYDLLSLTITYNYYADQGLFVSLEPKYDEATASSSEDIYFCDGRTSAYLEDFLKSDARFLVECLELVDGAIESLTERYEFASQLYLIEALDSDLDLVEYAAEEYSVDIYRRLPHASTETFADLAKDGHLLYGSPLERLKN